jgi:hypothetical protein
VFLAKIWSLAKGSVHFKGELKNAYKFLVETPEAMASLQRLKYKLEDNIKIDLK